MKIALVSIAALASLAIAERPDPTCDTPDADLVANYNDCQEAGAIGLEAHDESAVLPAGEWHTLGCTEKCKISIKPDEPKAFTERELITDINDINAACGIGDDLKENEYKGEISVGGKTVSVFKPKHGC